MHTVFWFKPVKEKVLLGLLSVHGTSWGNSEMVPKNNTVVYFYIFSD
jgi:hypothetical protein